MKRRPWTLKEIARAVELEAQGYSQREIAALLGHGRSGVCRHLAARSPRPRTPPSRLPACERALRRHVAEGELTGAAICRALSVSRSTLRRWLRLLGLAYQAPAAARHATGPRPELALFTSDRCRAYCRELGWPEVSCPTQARVLALLAASPAPLTHAEIARGLGMRLFRPPGREDWQGRSPALARHLARLAVGSREARLPGKVTVLPPPAGAGRALRYRVSDWLLARRNEGGRDER